MAKSILKLFQLCLLSFLSLSGCNQEEPPVVIPHLDYGTIHASPIEDVFELGNLSYDRFYGKIIDEDTFVLALYYGGCTCWDDFKEVIVEYTNNTNIKIYIMSVDYLASQDTFGLITNKNVMPSISIFKSGKLYIQQTYFDSQKLFKDYRELDEFIKENTIDPKQYYIDKEALDNKIKNNDEFVIYFVESRNFFFRKINKDVIHNWNYEIESINEPLYIFDLDEYTIDEDIDNYQYLMDLYGLSTVNNPTLGYQTGMIPALQKRKGNEILDMIVLFNDNQYEGVVSSYFSNDRIKNMPFLQGTSLNHSLDGMKLSKVDNTQDWPTNWELMKYDYYEKYQYPILKQFLSTYIE